MAVNIQADEGLVSKILDIGQSIWNKSQVEVVLRKTNNNLDQAIDLLLSNNADQGTQHQNMGQADNDGTKKDNCNNEDQEVQRAIQISLQTQQPEHHIEPLDYNQTTRIQGMPVGLKNIGNTCYVNSMFQVYFSIPILIKQIFNAPFPTFQVESKKKQANINLVFQCKKLFAKLMLSERNYINPCDVIRSITDDQGNQLQIGDQKDVGEFNMKFLAQLDEGIQISNQDPEENKLDPPVSSSNQETPIISLMNNSAEQRQSALTQEQKGNLQQIFFGKMKQLIFAQEQDESYIQEEKDVEFGVIILKLKQNNFYMAWDDYMFDKIDWKTPKEFSTKADQQFWIKNLPTVLSFQLQRVVYDKERSMAIKIHDAFQFPQELYADRFLLENREQALLLRQKMQEYQQVKTQLEQSLNQVQDYQNQKLQLGKIFELTVAFLQIQQSESAQQQEYAAQQNPLKIPTQWQQYQITEATQILQEFKDQIEQKMDQMTQELKSLNEKLMLTFTNPELSKEKYTLHSILIHDGWVDSGHYYAYIKDFTVNGWKKYNDIHITEVSEETVLQDAQGGKGMTSAYCLFYIRHEAIQICQDQNFKEFYKSFIPEQIAKEIYNDNIKFQEQLNDNKYSETAKKIRDLYQKRIQLADSHAFQYRNHKQQNPNVYQTSDFFQELTSFINYLLLDQSDAKRNLYGK